MLKVINFMLLVSEIVILKYIKTYNIMSMFEIFIYKYIDYFFHVKINCLIII